MQKNTSDCLGNQILEKALLDSLVQNIDVLSHAPKSYKHYLKTITALRKQISVLGLLEGGERKKISEKFPRRLDALETDFLGHLAKIETFINNTEGITPVFAKEIICSEENFPIFCAEVLAKKEEYLSEKESIENRQSLFYKLFLNALDEEYVEKYTQDFSPLKNIIEEELFALQRICSPEISDLFDTPILSYTNIEETSELFPEESEIFPLLQYREKNKEEMIQKKISALVYVFLKEILNNRHNGENDKIFNIFINRLSQQNILFDSAQISAILKNSTVEKSYPEIYFLSNALVEYLYACNIRSEISE